MKDPKPIPLAEVRDSTPVGVARTAVFALVDEPDGGTCPICAGKVKRYRRRITPAMARLCLTLARVQPPAGELFPQSTPADFGEPGEWVAVDDVLAMHVDARGDYSKLSYWTLVETRTGDDARDGRAEIRLTPAGVEFANDRLAVRLYALVFRGDCTGFDGPKVRIRAALSGFTPRGRKRRRSASGVTSVDD